MNRCSVNATPCCSAIERQRLPLDRSGARVGRRRSTSTVPPLTRNISTDPPRSDDRERGDERDQRDRLGQQRAGDGREHVAQAALQQIGEIGAEQHRDQDRRADDRHGEQHLKRGLGDELDRDRLPVGGGQQRAAFQQVLQVQSISL